MSSSPLDGDGFDSLVSTTHSPAHIFCKGAQTSSTLESDDVGSGKGHNFCTSVAVRSGFLRKFEGAFVGLQTRENRNISGSDVRNTYLLLV